MKFCIIQCIDHVIKPTIRRAQKDRIVEMPVFAGQRFITSKPFSFPIKAVQVAQ